MSTRRLSNIFKRKFFLRMGSLSYSGKLGEKEAGWFRNQFKDLSKLGGNLVVMKMGN